MLCQVRAASSEAAAAEAASQQAEDAAQQREQAMAALLDRRPIPPAEESCMPISAEDRALLSVFSPGEDGENPPVDDGDASGLPATDPPVSGVDWAAAIQESQAANAYLTEAFLRVQAAQASVEGQGMCNENDDEL